MSRRQVGKYRSFHSRVWNAKEFVVADTKEA